MSRPLGLALCALVAAGCRERAAPEPALVFATASLHASFQALVEAFEREHPSARIDLHVAGTPELVLAVREGAPADVLAAADEASLEPILAAGLALASPRVFAENHLAIATARGNPHGIQGLADLARADLAVALCGPGVPAGRYARAALAKAGVEVRSVSDEPSVRAVAGKLRLGEIDAGIVYATDVAAAAGELEAVALPPEHDVVATYPIVALASGRSRATGEAFLAFVLSPAGRGVLESFGFGVP